ncbi:MAG: biosynthetic-type acetolactate synthase large subunit [Lachnospiraceae bacterium]|nr:biosynthetic-type acetolactate synthase large subunit [Lachnospiraceae bacterium]
MEIKGTELFVKALKEEGVDTLFAYPGGMAIDLFDQLYDEDDIEVILPRHEQGLIHAADGYARATGNVGVCLVTSGPGATNLVTGIATANYDSVPLVCFTGQVMTNLIGNDAFQEVDIVGIARNICKYAVTVHKREDLGRIIKNAFYIARTGKPGPVLVDIPKDIQVAMGSSEYPESVNIRGYKPSTGVHAGQIKRVMKLMDQAKKPVFLVGGGVRISHAGEVLTQLVEKSGIPVMTTIMGKGAIDTKHPLYIGNIGMHGNFASNNAVDNCDLLISIGTRFSDRVTGTISEFAPNATIVHIDIDPASISRNIKVDVPIVADARLAIEAMLPHTKKYKISEWVSDIKKWKEEHPINMNNYEGMTPEKIIHKINEMFPELIITTDVGQNQLWASQYLELGPKKRLLTSGGLGTMGYGLPAAIGAKLGTEGVPVLCISGDGGVQMNIQEMATAVVMELPVILCVFNNGYLGNVRQMQELFYNKRYSYTCLRCRRSCEHRCLGNEEECPPYTPDFVKLAESYDAVGIRVEKEEDIEAAFQKAMSRKTGPTLIEFIIEREANVFPMVPGGKALHEMILDC